ncbi:MAG: DUF885 family protein [Candidatus Eisenbacteria bacterium]|nr:DUF885 family protein [Candidatus Latescibacterota bacterium]MBD3300999.1 DUF885 family protein [Candidatus Eisenbacteria bacterium]
MINCGCPRRVGTIREGAMPQANADKAFDQLAEKIFESYIDLNPIDGTWMGVHGANDARLPVRSAEAAEKELSVLQGLVRDLGAFRERELSPERVVELRLAKGGVTGRIQRLQRRPLWRRCPRCYVDDIVFGVYSLMIRDFAPVTKRARAVLGRLKEGPTHLEGGRQNLENPSPIFTEAAALSAHGAIDFLDTTMREFIASVPDNRLSGSLDRATSDLRQAMGGFAEWLEGNLMPRSHGDYAVGRAMFERLLSDEHFLAWTGEELIAAGQRIYQETLREMKRVAARIDPTRPWSKVVQSLKREHLKENEILPYFRKDVERARDFVARNRLATFPEEEALAVVPTPEFARPMTPIAAYLPPAPFADSPVGVLWVTTMDRRLDESHRESLLKEHPRWGTAITALHEAYPGRHLQQSRATCKKDRKLRFLFSSNSFAEGWSLYCEKMMAGSGFHRDDRSRLLQLKDLLWRACGVILDVELQTGRMGFNEAVTFLVRKAQIERQTAVAEVRRYCAHPTQPMSYVAGRAQIEELLEDYRAAKGDQFDLRRFHDELLDHGTIPIELIRFEMGIPRRKQERRGGRRTAAAAGRSTRH